MATVTASIGTVSKPNPQGNAAFSHFQYDLNFAGPSETRFGFVSTPNTSASFADVPDGTYVMKVYDVDVAGGAMDSRSSTEFQVTGGTGATYSGVDSVSVVVS